MLIWLVVIVLVCTGLSLRGAAHQSNSYAQGYSRAFYNNGTIIFIVGVILAGVNAFWGAARWIFRCDRERWRPSRIVGKLIGGAIWRLLVVIPLVLFASLFIAPKVKELIIGKVIDGTDRTNPVVSIEQDFRNGKITADDFINYLIDATYDCQQLPAEYQFDQLIMIPDFIDYLDENLDNLSPATLRRVLEVFSLDNVDFSTDASGNPTTTSSVFGYNAYAKSGDVKTLNKAIQSANGNFLVFYTDTGDDKISEDSARQIGTMMEDFVAEYQNNFDLYYHTEQIDFHSGIFNSKRRAMEQVLQANGIDAALLETAMPIYVINPFGSSSQVLATYTGRVWAGILERLAARLVSLFGTGEQDTQDLIDFYISSPVLPFILILPENITSGSLELAVAHEFGHHYASIYCYDTFGTECASEEDFIDETLPNYMTAMVVANQTEGNLISRHHDIYIARTGLALDTVGEAEGYAGYPVLAFLYNYADIVDDGKTKILNALMHEDAYWYLYDQAGSSAIAQVLSTLAIKNITNDYGDRFALYASELPKGEEIPCSDFCSVRYGSTERPYASSSIHYFYFPKSEFVGKSIKITNYTNPSNYTFDILGLRNNSWSHLASTTANDGFKIDFQSYADYDTIALAVSDYSPSDNPDSGFSLSISNQELETVVIEDDGSDEAFFGQYGNCIWMYTDGVISAAQQIVDVFKGIDGQLDTALTNWNAQTENAKVQIGNRKITICGRFLSYDADFESIKSSLSRNFHISLIDYSNSSIKHLSVIIDLNPFQNTAQAHLLVKDNQYFSLITATVE